MRGYDDAGSPFVTKCVADSRFIGKSKYLRERAVPQKSRLGEGGGCMDQYCTEQFFMRAAAQFGEDQPQVGLSDAA